MKATNQQSNARSPRSSSAESKACMAYTPATVEPYNPTNQNSSASAEFFWFPFSVLARDILIVIGFVQYQAEDYTFLPRHAAIQYWPDVSSLEGGVLTHFQRTPDFFRQSYCVQASTRTGRVHIERSRLSPSIERVQTARK